MLIIMEMCVRMCVLVCVCVFLLDVLKFHFFFAYTYIKVNFLFFRPLKWHLAVHVNFTRPGSDGEPMYTMGYFQSLPSILLNDIDMVTPFDDALSRIDKKVEKFTDVGSGWKVNTIDIVRVYTAAYDPIGGSSHIPLPKWIAVKGACVNIANQDDYCFLYSVLAVSHPQSDNAERVTNYECYIAELEVQGLSFPLHYAQISRFEEMNIIYAINVLYPNCEDKTFVPLYASPHRNRKHIVSLLLLGDRDHYHYVLIRNLSALLHSRNSHKGRIFPCPYCLYCFSTEAGKQSHMPECGVHGLQKVKYPSPSDNVLRFTKFENSFPLPFVIYSDFECLLEKPAVATAAATQICDTHIPSGFCCLTVSTI